MSDENGNSDGNGHSWPPYLPCLPGQYIHSSKPVICNKNRKTIKLNVRNTGDRPCQIGSQTHFFEVNKALEFHREDAYGLRLNIPAGTGVRFETGDEKEVELTEIGGAKIVYRIQWSDDGRPKIISYKDGSPRKG